VVGIDGIQDGLAAVKDGRLIGTSLQHGASRWPRASPVAQKVANGEQVNKTYTYTMPPITPQNVDEFYKNVVSEKDAFLQRLPQLVAQNLASGNLSNEQLNQSLESGQLRFGRGAMRTPSGRADRAGREEAAMSDPAGVGPLRREAQPNHPWGRANGATRSSKWSSRPAPSASRISLTRSG